MKRRYVLVWLAAAWLAFAAPADAQAAVTFRPCAGNPAVECATVPVPLDYSGVQPGSVPLHVERRRARNERGVMFLVAGGPGQASSEVFDLESLADMFPGYTLLAFDPRGTGASGVLQCRMRSGAGDDGSQAVASCGEDLGSRRRFFTTREHVEDVEAVRAAIDARAIGIWGTSYGTKLALAYALAHPTRVERLLLDSVLPLEGPDPFRLETLRAMPRALSALCVARACRGGRAGIARDVVELANRLARSPLRGRVLAASGRRRLVTVDAVDFLSMVAGADVHPGLATELPWAIGAAAAGDRGPLLRLAVLARGSGMSPGAGEFSPALFLATVCGDGPFPWDASTPPTDRTAAWERRLAGMPPMATGGFGSWAARTSMGWLCRRWPDAPTALPYASAAYPDVPVLALAGDVDMRTPVESAASVVARFPRGRVVIVPGVGHSVLTADTTGCAERAVKRWMGGRPVAARCPRVPSLVPALDAQLLGARPRRRLTRRATVAIAAATLAEAKASFIFAALAGDGEPSVVVPGLHRGRLYASGDELVLERYSVAAGVEVDGRLTVTPTLPRLSFRGRIRVCGRRAVAADVRVLRTRLRPRFTPRACAQATRPRPRPGPRKAVGGLVQGPRSVIRPFALAR